MNRWDLFKENGKAIVSLIETTKDGSIKHRELILTPEQVKGFKRVEVVLNDK